ncbi:MAG: helix-turn-helix domain-containing protein [Burkholderiaceae bacterium]|nr:helix-turn-helix domain-containing protein [Burkholderiaceae bacterium]
MDALLPSLPLSPDACYAVLQARDSRFDGKMYVGVTSTGIYCRPICRVRAPKRENCVFFAHAAQAEAAAFRPCLKCRPELAPGGALRWSVMDASKTLAQQAAAWLDGQTQAEASVEDLATHLGITSRHLRRIFAAEHGVTPLQYLQTRRLLLAKHLLTDTALPVTQVALQAGFASLRRFNAAFVEHYRLQPTALRREGKAKTTGLPSALLLAYRPPYHVDAMLEFLERRAIVGIETIDKARRSIRRSLRITQAGQGCEGWLEVTFDANRPQVRLSLSEGLVPATATVLPLVRRWLDLDADPLQIDAALATLPAHACQQPGVRLPGCVDRFELAVRAVLGQQVTVAAARTLASRFVQRFGTPLNEAAPEGLTRVFPEPEQIAAASRDDIASLGIIARRADALRLLAEAWPRLLINQAQATHEAAQQELIALPGLGPWTASYMLMRMWSWPDAFLPGDVVLRKQLATPGEPLPSPKRVLELSQAWQPYRSYAVMRLWRATTPPPTELS